MAGGPHGAARRRRRRLDGGGPDGEAADDVPAEADGEGPAGEDRPAGGVVVEEEGQVGLEVDEAEADAVVLEPDADGREVAQPHARVVGEDQVAAIVGAEHGVAVAADADVDPGDVAVEHPHQAVALDPVPRGGALGQEIAGAGEDALHRLQVHPRPLVAGVGVDGGEGRRHGLGRALARRERRPGAGGWRRLAGGCIGSPGGRGASALERRSPETLSSRPPGAAPSARCASAPSTISTAPAARSGPGGHGEAVAHGARQAIERCSGALHSASSS